jgi:phage terminase large subunit GpA-like protein
MLAMTSDQFVEKFRNTEGLRKAINNAAHHLQPPPNLKPSEWAEQNIRIPIGNAVPGLIRFDHAPYQREPLDMTANPFCNRITLMWSAQVGKTTLALCAQAFKIGQDPQSQIMMQPSQGDLGTWLETKFNPLVASNDELERLIAKPRGREGVNNQRMKSYPGGFLMFSWSGSAKTMRGRSAPFIVCDEVDGYDKSTEGHPVSLLWQRAATFGDRRKLLEISTPTIKGASWIESAFEAGDRRYFHVPCPHCGDSQTLRWSNVIWDEGKPDTAKYACSSCGVLWNDGERIAAIRKGEWVATDEFTGHASYHLNEMYSCFRKLGDIAQSFLDKKHTNDLQTFVNVSLAETWEEQGEGVEEHVIKQRAEDWGDKVPEQVAVLVAGVDVQDDRLEVEILGVGRDLEQWSVDYQTLQGDPSSPAVWEHLDSVLFAEYETHDGRLLNIRSTAIDTGGHHTQATYRYIKAREGRRVFGIKGIGGEGKPLVGRPSRNNIGKIHLFPVGSDTAKEAVFGHLRITDPGPGYCHFPIDRPDEYFEQLTAERRVTRYVRGHAKRQWVKKRARNEALDVRCYALAALSISGINVNTIADKMLAQSKAEKTESGEQTQDMRRRMQRKRPGGFVNNWRV